MKHLQLKTYAVEYKDFQFNLLPCPFCGGKPKIMDMGYPHWIFCLDCGARVHGFVNGEIEGVIESVKVWNKRFKYPLEVEKRRVSDDRTDAEE